jgi:hypothetical protein
VVEIWQLRGEAAKSGILTIITLGASEGMVNIAHFQGKCRSERFRFGVYTKKSLIVQASAKS